MGWLTEVTESEAIPLVGNKYNWFGTALESLESAILEEGYAFVNPYGETEPEALFINTEEDKRQLYEAKLRWMTAQSRALCRERCLLLMKIEVI